MSGHIPDRLEKLLDEDIREMLAESDDAISREYKLQDRSDNLVRMSLIREARSEVPPQLTQWYDPVQNVIVMLLPDDEEVPLPGDEEETENPDGEVTEEAEGDDQSNNPEKEQEQELNVEILNAIRGEDQELLAGVLAKHFDQVGELEQEVAKLRGGAGQNQ